MQVERFESAACTVTPVLPSTWGALKAAYR